MVKLLELPDALRNRRQHTLFDEFHTYVDADEWTLTATDAGTAAVGDAAGGVITIAASDGTEADNDESYLHTTHECWKVAADKPIMFEAEVSFTEANTDDANIMIGLSDTVAANTLLDDGGGPAASYDGAVFFKTDGATVWSVESSNATAQTTTATNITAGGSYQTLRIEIQPTSSTSAEVKYFIDGVQCLDANGATIKHTLTITGLAEMHMLFGVKNGDTNGETLLIDYACCTQLR
jgi:hypothetical protein